MTAPPSPSFVRFDDVPDILARLVDAAAPELGDVDGLHAIRDLSGQVYLVAPGDGRGPAAAPLRRLAAALQQALGAHGLPPDEALLWEDTLATDRSIFLRGPRLELRSERPRLVLVDRQVTGSAWSSATEADDDAGAPRPQRLAFYSLKGGVGRTTAAGLAALHLAERGFRVLVIDLDLEAPGLSSSLLPPDRLPAFGVVDWFVEDAVGQGAAVIREMIAPCPIARNLEGDIAIASAHGREPGDYLAKLGRCYLDLPGESGPRPWEARLVQMVRKLEASALPDVTILDTRAGLADLAAVALTDLPSDVFLFAQDSRQTWEGYRVLFRSWRMRGVMRAVRERLRLVAALVPETHRPAWLDGFRENAWTLFLEEVYDEVPPGAPAGDAFSFDLTDDSAPHAPLPVYWNRGLATFSSFDELERSNVLEAARKFHAHLDDLLPELPS